MSTKIYLPGTLKLTVRSHLKMDGWKTIVSFPFGSLPHVSGAFAVSFQGVYFFLSHWIDEGTRDLFSRFSIP